MPPVAISRKGTRLSYTRLASGLLIETNSSSSMPMPMLSIFFRPLLEVCLSPDQGVTTDERASFFKFLSLDNLSGNHKGQFSLWLLASKRAEDQKFFLNLQQSLFNVFIDRLRASTSETTLAILRSLPRMFQETLVLRPGCPTQKIQLSYVIMLSYVDWLILK